MFPDSHEFSKRHVGDCGGFVGGLDKLGVKGGLGLRGFLVITSVSWGDELCAQPFLIVSRVLAKAGTRAMSGSTRIPGWMPRNVTSWLYGGGHDARCDIRVGPCRLWKRLAEGEEGGHFGVCHGALALGVHHGHLMGDGVQLRGTRACWSIEGMWGRERVNVGLGGGEQHGEDHVVSVHEGDVMVT